MQEYCEIHKCGLMTRPHPDPFQANEGGVVLYCPQCEAEAQGTDIPF